MATTAAAESSAQITILLKRFFPYFEIEINKTIFFPERLYVLILNFSVANIVLETIQVLRRFIEVF